MKRLKIILSICLAFIYTTAFAQLAEVYRIRAEQGDASAQYNLGVCYKRGEGGVGRDYSKAVYWYREAAEQGLADAQHNLGVCYLNGEGVPQDIEKAVFWWEKAAVQGFVTSQYNLGYCYELGEGVDVDYNKAVYWYKKAAEQGDKDAQSALDDLVVSSTQNGYEYVDLGLSVKWATCNVGASNPWEYGAYYQWAGTRDVSSTSINLDWNNCPYHTGSSYSSGFTKYISSDNSSYWSGPGSPDDKTVLDSGDDVVCVELGGSWRMPTDNEWRELRQNCTWTWTTINGVNGYEVTSKKPNYTGRSIFLPAAGYRHGDNLNDVGSHGYYWSSSLYAYHPDSACSLYYYSEDISWATEFRHNGLSVRPVQK